MKYINHLIDTSYFGTCPSVACPHFAHSNSNYLATGDTNTAPLGKRRRLLIFSEWKNIVSAEVAEKFKQLASSLLAFLCGGCHALKSLDVGFDEVRAVSYFKEYLSSEKANPTVSLADITNELQSYSSGCLTVEEIYAKLTKNSLPDLMITPESSPLNDSIAWGTFIWVLRAIPDPERRANLHLRYLRDRPRIRTQCCNKEHCFHCRVKDFHEGKTCSEMTCHSLDHSIVYCPGCSISLAKGDGCNTVHCVCGKQFSWATEKEKAEKCQQFFEMYPENTSVECAAVLCINSTSSNVSKAKAWHSRYRREVDAALYQWFKTAYSTCPSQCCAILPRETMTEGAREAAEIWQSRHAAMVEKCKDQNRQAKEGLFLSMVPQAGDRPCAAYRLINSPRRAKEPSVPSLESSGSERATSSRSGSVLGLEAVQTYQSADRQLVDSAHLWVEKNKAEYLRGLEEKDLRAARQFLFLFGSTPPQRTRPAYIHSPCAFEWHRSSSNPDLTFSNNDTAVERAGSISCYPAAFARLVADRTSFVVVVEAAPLSSNWLTFGLSKVDAIANSSSDGVGRSRNTWGLSDDRSSLTSKAILSACGTEVGNFRKLKVGDTLSALVDTGEGWCEVSVNDQEFSHRFKIPIGNSSDYCFAMTFANDHKVSIMSDGDYASAITTSHYSCHRHSNSSEGSSLGNLEGVLTVEQTLRFNALKKQIRLILTGETGVGGADSAALVSSPSSLSSTVQPPKRTSALAVKGEEWVKLCKNPAEAGKCFDEIKPLLDCVVNVRQSKDWPNETSFKKKGNADEGNDDKDTSRYSWLALVKAASWYRESMDLAEQEQDLELANTFYMNHGDDAPFIAAITLADYHQGHSHRGHRVQQLRNTTSFFCKGMGDAAGKADSDSVRDEDPVAASLAFMRIFSEEAYSWYEYNAALSEPLIPNLHKDCKCLPRHTKQKCWC